MLGRIHWQAALVGYSAGSTDELLPATRRDPLAWWDTRRVPLTSYPGGIFGGIRWRATLGYSAGCSAGSTGGLLWCGTRRDPLASRSGGILGGIHWRAALAGYSLASSSGGTLGGIHWPAALVGYSAGPTGKPLWRDTRRDPLASCFGGILGGGVV